jgi:hypothetical protein
MIISKKVASVKNGKEVSTTNRSWDFDRSKWKNFDEENRLDVRATCVCPSHATWEMRIEIWGIPVTGDKRVLLRTLIDSQDVVFHTDDVGPVVTIYFTLTDEEIEQNQGAKDPRDFHFSCLVKGTQKTKACNGGGGGGGGGDGGGGGG